MAVRRAEHGLTLIELLVTLLIVAIVAAMAAPSFREVMAERKITAGARAFAATLRSAQAAAVARNRTVEILFTTVDPVPSAAVTAVAGSASGGRWMARVNPPAAATDFVDGHAVVTGSRGIEVASTADRLGFTPLGRPVGFASGAPVTLADTVVVRFTDTATSQRMCTYLTAGGSVRICDPTRASGEAGACQPQLAATAC